MSDRIRVAVQHFVTCCVAVPPEADVPSRSARAQVANSNVGQPSRKYRIHVKSAAWTIRVHAEDRLQKHEGRPGRTDLRHIGAEILDGEIGAVALHACIQLRQLVQHKVTPCLAHVARNLCRLRREAGTSEAERNDAIVMRPHGAVLLRVGIIRRMAGGEGADAPPGPARADDYL